MRVFAPRRLAYKNAYGFNGRKHAIGFPLEGEWRDVPDYFVQITRGQAVNDVTHAKLVDPAMLTYTVFDGQVKVDGYAYPFHQSIVDDAGPSGLYFVVNYADITTERVTAILEPSPNYKGKNPKREERTITIRHRRPFVMNGFFNPMKQPDKTYTPIPFVMLAFPDFEVDSPPVSPLYCRNQTAWFSSKTDPITGRAHVTVATYTPNVEVFEPLAQKLDSFVWDSQRDWPSAEATLAMMVNWVCSNYDALKSSCTGRQSLRIVDMLPEDFPAYEPREGYVLNEDYVFVERLDPMLLGTDGGFNTYWRNYLTEHALLSACESLPRLSDNSIQNLSEIAGFIKSVVVDRKIEIPKSLADAWLSYRYSYSTTRMDIQEAIKFVHRHMDLGTLDREIVSYGSARHQVNGANVLCRCSVKVRPKNVDILRRIWRALGTYGLTPDFYVIWDSIPYSFMVDWFLPIGDLAGVWDANSMYFSGEFYEFSDITYSLSYTRGVNGLNIHCYTRWLGSVPPSLHSRYWFDAPSASATTVGKRVLDAASIFIGH